MLRIVETILDLIVLVRRLADQIARHDAALAKQLRGALSSVALNTAEGSDQLGGRRKSHYTIALGSARESFVALRAAAAWGHIPELEPKIANGFNTVIGTLVKNTRK